MKSRKTIFIADDDENLVHALTKRCQNLGFQVDSASDGIEAVVSVVSDPPDLLMLDIGMPGADGLTACEKIMKYQSFEPVPIILLTGKSDRETKRSARMLGAHYVCKGPQAWETIQPMIFELLNAAEDQPSMKQSRSVARSMRRGAKSSAA